MQLGQHEPRQAPATNDITARRSAMRITIGRLKSPCTARVATVRVSPGMFETKVMHRAELAQAPPRTRSDCAAQNAAAASAAG